MNGEQYDVDVQLDAEDRASPRDAGDHLPAHRRNGEMVQLSNLVKVDETVAPKELNRFNQLRSVTISANLAPGVLAGRGAGFLWNTAREVLPATCRPTSTARAASSAPRARAWLSIFVLALGFIYLVLAAQFESFRDPLIIMMTVPLSMTGALAALYLTGGIAERLLADRAGDAGRAHHQARHPDRRVRQPAAGRRQGRVATRWSKPRRCACGRS